MLTASRRCVVFNKIDHLPDRDLARICTRDDFRGAWRFPRGRAKESSELGSGAAECASVPGDCGRAIAFRRTNRRCSRKFIASVTCSSCATKASLSTGGARSAAARAKARGLLPRSIARRKSFNRLTNGELVIGDGCTRLGLANRPRVRKMIVGVIGTTVVLFGLALSCCLARPWSSCRSASRFWRPNLPGRGVSFDAAAWLWGKRAAGVAGDGTERRTR